MCQLLIQLTKSQIIRHIKDTILRSHVSILKAIIFTGGEVFIRWSAIFQVIGLLHILNIRLF